MFKKEKCPRCKNKIGKSFEFCSSCGLRLNSNKNNEFGMLGKNDFLDDENDDFNPFSNSIFSGGMLGKMLNSTVKMLEKELAKEMKNSKNFQNENFLPRTNFQLFINGKPINLSQNSKNFNQTQQAAKPRKKTSLPTFTKQKAEKYSKLEKQEPLTNIRRLENKVIYELEMPGVKEIDDVSIARLENSVEIKAIADKTAYKKIIPINLPLYAVGFSEGNLVLELVAKG